MWLSADGKVFQITPAGQVTGVPLPHRAGGIANGPDGAIWYTERRGIGRIASGGAVTEFPLPFGDPLGIAAGADGALWLTNTVPDDRTISRVTVAGVETVFPLPRGARPMLHIIRGPDGAIWFSEPVVSAIGRITTTGEVRSFELPVGPTFRLPVAAGPDGEVWFAGDLGSGLGRISPAGKITRYRLPCFYDPFAITAGPDGAMWVTTPEGIGRITERGEFTLFRLPAPGRERLPLGLGVAIATASDGAIWFARDPRRGRSKLGRLDPSALAHRILQVDLGHSRYRARAGAQLTLRYTVTRRARMNVSVSRGCNDDYATREPRAHPGMNTLHLRALRKPGRYLLELSADAGRQFAGAEAEVIVRRRP